MPPLPSSSRISSPWNDWPVLRGRSSGGAVGSVDFCANPAMHLEQRSPEKRLPQVEHFFMVFISPPCIEASFLRGYIDVMIFLRRRIVISSGQCRKQFLEFLVHFGFPLHRPGDLLLQEVPVAAPGAVDDDLDVGFRQPQPDGHLLQGDRKSTRLNSSHTVIYTLSLHDALPIWRPPPSGGPGSGAGSGG